MAKKSVKARSTKKRKQKPESRARRPKRPAAPRRAAPVNPEDGRAQLRTFHARFSAAVPSTMTSSGAHEFTAGSPSYGDVAKLADGHYRVEGGDFIYTVKGGAVVLAERARPDADPASYTAVAAAAPAPAPAA